MNAYPVIAVKLVDFDQKILARRKNLLASPSVVYFHFTRWANISFA